MARTTPTCDDVLPSEIAYAKINLALHVRRRGADGYHVLETIFAFCSDGDRVAAAVGQSPSLTITGPFASGLSTTDNLVVRAANLFQQFAALTLDKRLPIASGIGGGSADAAATLRLLSRLTGEPMPPSAARRAMGADVPACVVSATRRGDGAGEVLSAGPDVTGMPILLVNPMIALSTAAVFGAWDGIDRGPLGPWRDGRNDLETPAMSLVPQIGALLDWLRQCAGVTVARMSGSGATCFALFETPAERAAAAAGVSTHFPGYWIMESTLR